MASPCSREKGARKSFCSREKGTLQGQGKGVLGRKPHFTLGSPAVVSLKPASWEINRGLWKRNKRVGNIAEAHGGEIILCQ